MSLALAHPVVRGVLRGRQHSVRADRWRACAGERPFGAVVLMTLRAPVSVEGSFPMWDYRPGTHTRYFTGVVRIRASGVRTIGIFVDVTRNRVVAVDPTFGDGVKIHVRRIVEAFRAGPRASC